MNSLQVDRGAMGYTQNMLFELVHNATPRKNGVSARMQSECIAKHIVSFREGCLCKIRLSVKEAGC